MVIQVGVSAESKVLETPAVRTGASQRLAAYGITAGLFCLD